MQRIIEGKVYDTEVATEVASREGGLPHVHEALYLTGADAWFRVHEVEGSDAELYPCSLEEAHDWLEERHFADALFRHFPGTSVTHA